MNKTPIESDSDSFWIQRVLAGAAAIPFGALALWTRPTSVPTLFQYSTLMEWAPFTISPAAATVAILCCWFLFRGHLAESRESAGTTLVAAVIFGAIGLLGGVVGAALLKPTSAQGAFVGIFLIGPLCFVLGAIAGYVYAHIRHSMGSHRE